MRPLRLHLHQFVVVSIKRTTLTSSVKLSPGAPTEELNVIRLVLQHRTGRSGPPVFGQTLPTALRCPSTLASGAAWGRKRCFYSYSHRALSVDKNFLIMHEYHQATELNSVIND